MVRAPLQMVAGCEGHRERVNVWSKNIVIFTIVLAIIEGIWPSELQANAEEFVVRASACWVGSCGNISSTMTGWNFIELTPDPI